MRMWLPKEMLKEIVYKDLEILIVSSFALKPTKTDFTKKIDQ